MVTRDSLKQALAKLDSEMAENGVAGQGKDIEQHYQQLVAREHMCRNLDRVLTIEHRLQQNYGSPVRVAFDYRNGEPVMVVNVLRETRTVYGRI
jgi:hypothetical protein